LTQVVKPQLPIVVQYVDIVVVTWPDRLKCDDVGMDLDSAPPSAGLPPQFSVRAQDEDIVAVESVE
jgi:hypothetical protein